MGAEGQGAFLATTPFQVGSRSPLPSVWQVISIEPKWLLELAPRFFQQSNPRNLSKRKRQARAQRHCSNRRPAYTQNHTLALPPAPHTLGSLSWLC